MDETTNATTTTEKTLIDLVIITILNCTQAIKGQIVVRLGWLVDLHCRSQQQPAQINLCCVSHVRVRFFRDGWILRWKYVTSLGVDKIVVSVSMFIRDLHAWIHVFKDTRCQVV